MSYNEVNRKWADRQYYKPNITIITVLFSGHQTNIPHSTNVYNPEYVDKLYRGIARNFRGTFDFICLTDQNYKFKEPIIQNRLSMSVDQYGWMCMVDVYRPELCTTKRFTIGLDTIITGSLDDIFEHNTRIGLCGDPYTPQWICNAVTLASPEFCEEYWNLWAGNTQNIMDSCLFFNVPSEMAVLRKYYNNVERLDRTFPGKILSYKAHVLPNPYVVENSSIVYCHGEPKPHQITDEWIKEHWV